MTVSADDYADGWIYAAAMRLWSEIDRGTRPREVVRIAREDLHLAGGNPDRPAVILTPELARSIATALAGGRWETDSPEAAERRAVVIEQLRTAASA